MAENDFKHLGKGELIEIIYQMKKTETELREKLEEAQAQLQVRELKIAEAGSLAEAVVRVNNLFEVAQKTADEYLAQVYSANADTEERCKRLSEETEQRCAALKQETEERCKQMSEEAEQKCAALERETEERCSAKEREVDLRCVVREREAEQFADEKWNAFQIKAQEYIDSHAELTNILLRK